MDTPAEAQETQAMNLRESRLSSRCVIPVALALPINRGPIDARIEKERERRKREAEYEAPEVDHSVQFYL